MYTEQLSERWEYAGKIELAAATYAAEQNSGRIDVGKYTRLRVTVIAYDGGAETLDIDHEQADAESGGTLKTLDTNAFDVTMAADENSVCFEIPLENFDATNYFGWYNLEITPSGARNFGAIIEGLVKQAPASTALWDAVVGV
jgi:hypothetical protein